MAEFFHESFVQAVPQGSRILHRIELPSAIVFRIAHRSYLGLLREKLMIGLRQDYLTGILQDGRTLRKSACPLIGAPRIAHRNCSLRPQHL